MHEGTWGVEGGGKDGGGHGLHKAWGQGHKGSQRVIRSGFRLAGEEASGRRFGGKGVRGHKGSQRFNVEGKGIRVIRGRKSHKLLLLRQGRKGESNGTSGHKDHKGA